MTNPTEHDSTRSATNTSLRSGAILAFVVAVIVSVTGLLQWDLRLMTIGLVAGVGIVCTGGIVAVLRRWHLENTEPGANYLSAEDVVRLRSPKGP